MKVGDYVEITAFDHSSHDSILEVELLKKRNDCIMTCIGKVIKIDKNFICLEHASYIYEDPTTVKDREYELHKVFRKAIITTEVLKDAS